MKKLLNENTEKLSSTLESIVDYLNDTESIDFHEQIDEGNFEGVKDHILIRALELEEARDGFVEMDRVNYKFKGSLADLLHILELECSFGGCEDVTLKLPTESITCSISGFGNHSDGSMYILLLSYDPKTYEANPKDITLGC